MQPEQKLSRFMFHLKFSQTEEYVHEHELYEVMRSRNLYQIQFGVRSNFRKTMRNLTKSEKQTKYNFENNRKIFVQKMKERREQVDKLRNNTTTKLNRMSMLYENSKPIERQYIPLPQATVVYTDLPPIEPREKESHVVDFVADEEDTSQSVDKLILPAAAPSPSMVATNYTSDTDDRPDIDLRKSPDIITTTAKCLVVSKTSKTSPRTVTTKTVRRIRQSDNMDQSTTVDQSAYDDELVDELKSLNLDEKKPVEYHMDQDFESNAKLGRGKAQVSTVYFTDDLPKRHKHRRNDVMASESKAQQWAEKHGIQNSKADVMKEQDFQRLLIDRPSKWALNTHHTHDQMQSRILDMRLQYSRKMLNASFKRKSRQLDQLSEKLNLKRRISLPELNTAPKQMVALDPGGTTPDGRLILTKADYQAYLSNYRKARTVRLERSKVKNKNLEKRIENFTVEPQLCLRDETCLRASLRTI